MNVHRSFKRFRVPVTVLALLIGAAIGALLLGSRGAGEAEQREDFAHNLEFFKRGREDFAVCVSDYTNAALSESNLLSRVETAVGENKATLWDNSFLENEPILVDSPCPKGPTVTAETGDVMDYLSSIPVVEEPGPYILYVHVVGRPVLDTLDRLNLTRIQRQELADFTPNQPAGYEQVAAALYLSREEFEDGEFLARQIAEALGCTEGCAPPPR